MNADRWLVGGSNVVACLFGIFVGLALTDFSGIETFLEKWQTLITGILAIVAAVLTILAMIWTDSRQQTRHADLRKLELRAERLRAQRAASYSSVIFDLSYLLPEMADNTATELNDVRAINRALHTDVSAWVGEVERSINHRLIAEAKDLFDPQMATTFENIAVCNVELRKALQYLDVSGSFGNEENAKMRHSGTVDAFRDLRTLLDTFSGQLEGLGATYGAS
ncbi:TrbC/VirB2 family protein [Mesorhizobium sp. M0808]|uniref:hypothetical protein n=1 Tax=Mesorhizobium sp. M0808 TaxID=2957002 RepID=UPI00333C295C